MHYSVGSALGVSTRQGCGDGCDIFVLGAAPVDIETSLGFQWTYTDFLNIIYHCTNFTSTSGSCKEYGELICVGANGKCHQWRFVR